MMAIEIRPVTTIEECRHIEAIACEAWGGGPEIAIPDHLSITVARENGGVLLLAWDGEKPVGFCWGFLSYTLHGEEKRLKHCSHLTGVLPAYRGLKVGEQLKWTQRQAVLAMDIDHITWTYDPLETLNGRLNIHKLGAVCHSYRRNIYNNIADALNRGIPTDRFYVDWWLNSPWVIAHHQHRLPNLTLTGLLAAGTPVLNPVSHWVDGLPHPSQQSPALPALQPDQLLLAVPRQFQAIKAADLGLALAWRLHSQTLFEAVFAAGYSAIDLIMDDTLCYYLLQYRFFAKDVPDEN